MGRQILALQCHRHQTGLHSGLVFLCHGQVCCDKAAAVQCQRCGVINHKTGAHIGAAECKLAGWGRHPLLRWPDGNQVGWLVAQTEQLEKVCRPRPAGAGVGEVEMGEICVKAIRKAAHRDRAIGGNPARVLTAVKPAQYALSDALGANKPISRPAEGCDKDDH